MEREEREKQTSLYRIARRLQIARRIARELIVDFDYRLCRAQEYMRYSLDAWRGGQSQQEHTHTHTHTHTKEQQEERI
jgi:hypothetical protein